MIEIYLIVVTYLGVSAVEELLFFEGNHIRTSECSGLSHTQRLGLSFQVITVLAYNKDLIVNLPITLLSLSGDKLLPNHLTAVYE